MNPGDPRWDDPDYDRSGNLLGDEDYYEPDYNPDDDPDWGKHPVDDAK